MHFQLACIVEGQGDLEAVPVRIRDAKRWLTARMPGDQHYVETLDQPALAAILDLESARRADSFDKLWRDLTDLLARYARRP
jgi:hypothetical protein